MAEATKQPRYGLRKRAAPSNNSQPQRTSSTKRRPKPKAAVPSNIVHPPTNGSTLANRTQDSQPPALAPTTAVHQPTTNDSLLGPALQSPPPATVPANSIPQHHHVDNGSLSTAQAIDNNTPDQLTIGDRTFLGPLPPNKITDPTGNALYFPGNHTHYRLFTCAHCPISDVDHVLCAPQTHPCIWSFPPKAREAFANRHHWLAVGKPLEMLRDEKGRLPKLLDEAGKPFTRGLLLGGRRGVNLDREYDEVVRRRWCAVLYYGECRIAGGEYGVKTWGEDCRVHLDARLRMLEDMGWRFDW